jgi:hypothetical protein
LRADREGAAAGIIRIAAFSAPTKKDTPYISFCLIYEVFRDAVGTLARNMRAWGMQAVFNAKVL